MRRYDAVLFDLDGTLLDTAPEIAASVNGALSDLGLSAVAPDRVRRFIGHGVRETIARAYDAVHPGPPDAVQRDADLVQGVKLFGKYYGEFARLSQPFPETVATLRELRELGVKCAIVSNKETHFVEQLLANSPIPGLMDLVICGDTLEQKKPDPLPAMHVLMELGISPDRALFVGDSAIDVACARNAGIDVWLVPYGYNGDQPASAAGADYVMRSLSEVAYICAGAPV